MAQIRRLLVIWIMVTAALSSTACGISVPADPDDTLERVRGGTLRVGVSPHPPWTEVGADGRPAGREVELVTAFANQLQAEPEWVIGGEEQLVTRLEHGQLDLVIGGITADTPWSDKVSVTRPYLEATDAAGKPIKLVMAAPMGENAFLRSLEVFLHEQPGFS